MSVSRDEWNGRGRVLGARNLGGHAPASATSFVATWGPRLMNGWDRMLNAPPVGDEAASSRLRLVYLPRPKMWSLDFRLLMPEMSPMVVCHSSGVTLSPLLFCCAFQLDSHRKQTSFGTARRQRHWRYSYFLPPLVAPAAKMSTSENI